MPKEASNHFGDKLVPFTKAVALSNPDASFEEMTDLPPEIRNALICCHGELTPKFKYIEEMRKIREQTRKH